MFQLYRRFVQPTKEHAGPRVERLSQNGNFFGPRWRWKVPGHRRMRPHAERSSLGHLRSVQCRAVRRIFRTQVRHQLRGE